MKATKHLSQKTGTRKVPARGRKMTVQEAIRHANEKFGPALEKLAK